MKKDDVIFTQQMVTVFVEHNKAISKVLKYYYNMTSTEFCILRALYLDGLKANGMDFTDFLFLRRNSISVSLTNLERLGYVNKTIDSNDKRKVIVEETCEGVEVTRDATSDIYCALTNSFWRNLAVEEHRGGNQCASLVLEKIRGKPTNRIGELRETNTPITPEFIIFCKVVPQMWMKTLHAFENLSLSEYRILVRSMSSSGPVYCADLSRALFLDRSVISSFKDKMVEKGYIVTETSEKDKRNFELTCTEKGETLAERATTALSKQTSDLYSLCDEKLIKHVNEWHVRMFNDMNVFNALL